ncbi:uncharacterized protein LOC135198073 [Macrobrachium nipponense]|uniref:uncharacterized protein LOC135198073 n=1 Tax=Macrobrachium nipponense TaxID=159736 RepID=UPI0030C86BE1
MKLCTATITVLLVGLLEPCLSFPPAADAPLPLYGALYEGSHEGNANTYSKTDTDSRGLGTASMQAGLSGTGRLDGAVLTGGPDGNKAGGRYFGDLQGQGAMNADTQSFSTPTGSVSRTSTESALTGPSGRMSGGSFSGASSPLHLTPLTWRK